VTATDVIGPLRRRYQDYTATHPAAPFTVATPDGATHPIGAGEPAFTIAVTDPRGGSALASLDQFAVATAYLRGWLDLDGDLLAAFALRDLFHDRHPLAWLGRHTPALVLGRVEHDRRAVSSHYDQDVDFFRTFLDTRHRGYSEGVFARDDEPLEDAMTRKLQIALDVIEAKPGDRVLDVGAGFGAFAEFAARRGVEVTGLTLSAKQERFVADLAAGAGLPVTILREHVYRFRADRPFDAIVNMGASEHLPDYKATLRTYARLLRPGGRVYLDALAMRTKHKVSTFLMRHIFPGNSRPVLLHQYLRHVAHSPFELLSVEDDRHNYHLTCAEWARRLDAARDEVVRRWGEPLYRRFRLFLWGSAAGFSSGMVQAYRWVLRLPDAAG
jgi:cyclopropane-fatty-acyl-phospholipid synthase